MAMRFWSLSGLTPYEKARELQLRLVELRARDLIPDTVLFLEHEPVVTRGRGLQFTGAPGPRQMPLVGALPPGIAYAETERGGDLTYHGPGQLVVYPICKLDGQGFGPSHDIGAFLRKFEQVFIDVLMDYFGELGEDAIVAEARENATGVWIQAREVGLQSHKHRPSRPAQKIASMGIAIRRWVTYHGLAINCVNDLKPYSLISPCGFSPDVMTRLLDWLPAESDAHSILADWEGQGRADLEERLTARLLSEAGTRVDPSDALSIDILRLSCGEAWNGLGSGEDWQ
jgi:lipoyl(octanoyl) transferase